MIIFEKFTKIEDELSITIGTFDGIHIGHLKIINKLNSFNEKKLILSFFPPPFIYFKKESKVLYLPKEKIDILSKYNIDYLLSVPFNSQIKNLEPKEFIDFLIKYLNVKRIVVGKNFKFGKERKGDINLLKKLCEDEKIELIILEEEKFDGEKISSSKIRKLIKNGEIENANQFLTTQFFIKFLNNNFSINPLKLIPPDGNYLVKLNDKNIEINISNQKININKIDEDINNLYFIKKL